MADSTADTEPSNKTADSIALKAFAVLTNRFSTKKQIHTAERRSREAAQRQGASPIPGRDTKGGATRPEPHRRGDS